MEAFPSKSRPLGAARDLPGEAIVTATARLHFGFLDPSGRSDRPFGSFGLSLDRPATRLVLRRGDRFAVSGPERERGERYLKKIAASCDVEETYALQIEEAIPPHAGLGSGTQLALAVGSAFAALETLDLQPQEIAARLGRGARSGIGIATFAQGGVVLDGGPLAHELPKLVSRVPFPSEWRVILIFDEDVKGLAGASETTAFETSVPNKASSGSDIRPIWGATGSASTLPPGAAVSGRRVGLGLKGRLQLAFGAITLLVVIATGVGLYAFFQVGKSLQRITEEALPPALAASELSIRAEFIVGVGPAGAVGGTRSDRTHRGGFGFRSSGFESGLPREKGRKVQWWLRFAARSPDHRENF